MNDKTCEILKETITVIKRNTYICGYCNKIIFPHIEFSDDNTTLTITSDENKVIGGIGNRISYQICDSCRKKMTLKHNNSESNGTDELKKSCSDCAGFSVPYASLNCRCSVCFNKDLWSPSI